MINVERTFNVSKPVAEVIDYLKDFAHAEQWDPGTKRCTREGADGPIAVGTTWHNVSELRGRQTELEYKLITLEPGHLTFRGTNKTATSTDDITVVPSGAGSTITYHARIEFNGLAKLAGPLLGREFEKLGDQTRDTLIEVIGRL